MNGIVNIYSSSAGVEDRSVENLPLEFSLKTPYPNPFNSEAVIEFGVPMKRNVRISVTDILGREVAVLADAPYNPGYYSVEWNAVHCASGIYLVRMTAGEESFTQKICLVK